jgi:hypothetical protein
MRCEDTHSVGWRCGVGEIHAARDTVRCGMPCRLEYLRDTFQIKEGDFLSFDAIRQSAQALDAIPTAARLLRASAKMPPLSPSPSPSHPLCPYPPPPPPAPASPPRSPSPPPPPPLVYNHPPSRLKRALPCAASAAQRALTSRSCVAVAGSASGHCATLSG